MSSQRLLLVLLLAPLLVLAGVLTCTEHETHAGQRLPLVLSEPGFPVRLGLADGTELTIDAPPMRILPANAGAVDYVSLLVEPERVVALPEPTFDYSRLAAHGQGWRAHPRFTGYVAENILALEPDLVISHGWQSIETTAIVRANGIQVLELPTPRSWHEIRASFELLGQVLGADERARAELTALDRRVALLRERGALRGALRGLSYSNLGTGGWVGGGDTTADILFELVGLQNAANERELQGYRPVDIEMLLALDPDVFVVGTTDDGQGTGPTMAFLRGEPLVADLRAVRADKIISLPPRLFTTSSTELVHSAELLAGALDR